MCNRLNIYGHANTYLYQKHLEIDPRLLALETEMPNKCTKTEMKDKHQKSKKRFIADMDELKKNTEKKLLDIE